MQAQYSYSKYNVQAKLFQLFQYKEKVFSNQKGPKHKTPKQALINYSWAPDKKCRQQKAEKNQDEHCE